MTVIPCPECGRGVSEFAPACPQCGFPIAAQPPFPYPEPDLGSDAGMRFILPIGRSGWAIASGYLALISPLALLLHFPFFRRPSLLLSAIPAGAVVTGIMAILEMQRNPKKHGMGRAVFGIVFGGIITAVCAWLYWTRSI